MTLSKQFLPLFSLPLWWTWWTLQSVEARGQYVFPSVTSTNLEGKQFRLPQDFEGAANIVFVAFQQRQQRDVDSWIPSVKQTLRRFPHVRYYELPTLSGGYSFVRGFIDGGMRNGIADKTAREATITLYLNKAKFCASLGIASEDDITVLLVRPDGTLLWRTEGAYTPDKYQALTSVLSTLF